MQKRYWLLINSLLIGVLVLIGITIQRKNWHIQQPSAILFVTKTLHNEFHREVIRGATRTASRYGFSLEVRAPEKESDYEFQIAVLRSVINNPSVYAGLLVAPNDSLRLVKALNDVGRHGLHYVIVDTRLSDKQAVPTGDCGFVGTDNVYGGTLAAEFIGQLVQAGNVVLLRGVHSHETSRERENGFLQRISHFPNIHVVATLAGEWDPETAKQSLVKFLPKYSNSIDAIFAYNDPMALALAMADLFANHKQRPMILGYNADAEAQQALLEDHIDATIVQTPDLMGALAVEQLMACLNGAKRRIIRTPVSLMKRTVVLTTVDTLMKD